MASSIDQSAWRDAFLKEIDRYALETPNRVVTSVFFGGGTPSLMDPSTVDAVINAIASKWSLSNNVEITLEANPTSIEAAKFVDYREAGINRVSIGVQALNNADLKALGRLHTAEEALNAVEIGRSTFENVSFDLIYARQHQSLQEWESELTQALSYDPTHLSLYQLTIEDGTAFGDRYRRGTLLGLPEEDLSADMYFATQDLCHSHSLPAYEVSNHANTGHESQHNQIYWRGGDYIGIGPGAHGRLTIGNARIATETFLTPGEWLTAAGNGNGDLHREKLPAIVVNQETLMMGLRMTSGVDFRTVDSKFINWQKLQNLQDMGFLELENDILKTSNAGRPLLNHILREIWSDEHNT